ncbi:hypothetical protein [Dongia sp. agr-C8]
MADDLGTFRSGIQRFRSGGIAIAALPLVLGVALLLAGERVPALEMLAVSVILIFLILWATHCMEDAIGKLQAGRKTDG